MNVIVAGKNNIAVDVVEWLIEKYPEIKIFGVTNSTDNGCDTFQRSYKKFCSANDIPILSLEDAYLVEGIFISLEFDKIIDTNKFKKSNCFNIHFSNLPKYKGMYTSAWPIINAEEKAGVTLHEIDNGIDTGDIISQKEFLLDENETAGSLYLKYIRYGTQLVKDVFPDLIEGKYERKKQNHINSSYYSKKSIDYKNVKIELNRTAFQIKQQINAFTFRYYQLPKVLGYDIFGSKVLEDKSILKAGSVVEDNYNYVILSSIDYNIMLFKDNFSKILELSKSATFEELVLEAPFHNILLEKNEKGWSPIIVAAYHGNIELIKKLVEIGADVNDTNYNGTTVAMYLKNYVVKSKDYHLMEELVALGADLNIRDYNGLNIFDYLELSKIDEAEQKFFKELK
ncbi:formyltransferase family protein [Pectobacterium carotovorum]|uniref:formyltransferase family protein n=1 Tax=Pectobacterium carotovorum TaxID=554 RepID=UPI0029D6B81B|nr:formyltransferase family protein [Pectobacterium carotovorum]MDX6914043.1 formyltransferase family protein [Pectobacterium carotovorum]